MTGYLAESMTWAINPDQTTATATLEVRQGVHWALNPASEASRLVNGRELTADDIVYDLNTRMNDPRSWSAGAFPSVKGVQAVKTGTREVQLTFPVSIFMTNIPLLLYEGMVVPPR